MEKNNQQEERTRLGGVTGQTVTNYHSGKGPSHNLQNVVVIQKKHEKADDEAHGLVVVAVPDAAAITREKDG